MFFNTNGDFQKQVTVGSLPDMITFSPDGNKILTANEGQPNADYSIDPEGSVSIIDISGGIASIDQSKVTTLLFDVFNAQESSLIASGIRKTKLTSTLSQDLEPEYITISSDSQKAWVALQENNAIAELDLLTNTFTDIWPLGKKDFNVFGAGLDASDNSAIVHISNYPVKSYYMPDGVANYTVNGKNYLVTANEGDEKEYGSFVERTTVSALTLDPTVFPNAEVLKQDNNLGRLRVTSFNGDKDNDGDFDELIMPGARSFSIFDADTRSIVYDSGDDFELYTSKTAPFSAIFNADNENNNFKSRSRAKGPEPEGVTVATINGSVYAFIGLERIGGVMVYNITDPANVKFVDYKNNRSESSLSGDLGPEGIIYIPAASSPDGKAYIAIANELSGNISVFSVNDGLLPVELITFEAQSQPDGTVKLEWSTASEKDNDYFTLEKSHNGKDFVLLQKIHSKGDASSRQNYSLTDVAPFSGTSYYRLTQTDKNGTVSKAETRSVKIDALSAEISLKVYPNPLTGNVISVSIPNVYKKEVQAAVFDIKGKLISKEVYTVDAGKFEIVLADKPTAGIYILQITGFGSTQIIVNN